MSRARASRRIVKQLRRADEAAAGMAAPYRGTPVVKAASVFSEISDQPQMRLLSAALIGAGLLSGKKRLAQAGARMLAAHEVATLAKDLVKNRVDRHRPRSAARARQKEPRPGSSHRKEVTSFPSGHSAGATAAALAFSREYPLARPVTLALAGVAALAQVPRRAHYLTDVIAGVAVGVAAEALSNAISRVLAGGSR